MDNNVKLTELREFISCPVCQDYLIEATTVSECLHTFCKSCIIKHIKDDHNECPKCNTVIHERRPLDYIVHDRNKQDIVYKLVPHLYIGELKKRIASGDPEVDELTRFLVEENCLNIILAFKESNKYIDPVTNICTTTTTTTSQQQPETTQQAAPSSQFNQADLPNASNPIFLMCPFTVRVRCLRKLLIMKYQLGPNDKVNIYYKGDIISDDDLVSNLAQSLTFRFQYQISRLSVKEETTEAYVTDTTFKINSCHRRKNRLMSKEEIELDSTEEEDDDDDEGDDDEEGQDEDEVESQNSQEDESTDEDVDIPRISREQLPEQLQTPQSAKLPQKPQSPQQQNQSHQEKLVGL